MWSISAILVGNNGSVSISKASSGAALVQRQSALGVVPCASAGGRRPELAVVMPGAEQQGTHCLIRLSESRATAVFLQGFKDVFWRTAGK